MNSELSRPAARRTVASALSVSSVLSALSLLVPSTAQAQALDRTNPPSLATPAPLRTPPVATAQLANGARLYVVEMHKVPLVQVVVRLHAGARFEGKPDGIAAFTAAMLSEGAGTRDAAALAAQQAFLGATLGAGASWDYLTIRLNAPVRTLEPALDLLSDMIVAPRFRGADVTRLRNIRLAQYVAALKEPRTIGYVAFNATIYPATHPYHRPLGGDSAAIASFDSAQVRQFHTRAMTPRGADIIVTGDITLAAAVRLLNKHLAAWQSTTASPLTAPTPAAPVAQATIVTLVDKPDAAQSAISIGGPGVERGSPDYAALEVMNTILGGSFSSRLNQNLRETHGYTYGAQSFFDYEPLTGPFEAAAAVRTDVTDSSLAEFFKEFRSIRDSAVSDPELHRAINYLVLGLPGQFETTGDMAEKVDELLTFHLPFGYYDGYGKTISAVTAADVQRVARKYLDPAHLTVVVVGDLAKIKPGIQALGLGPIQVVSLKDLVQGH